MTGKMYMYTRNIIKKPNTSCIQIKGIILTLILTL